MFLITFFLKLLIKSRAVVIYEQFFSKKKNGLVGIIVINGKIFSFFLG